MNLRIGTDLVYIPKVERLLANQSASHKVFHSSELKGSVQHLAGIFAAKEAFFKAQGTMTDWLSIEVVSNAKGQPKFRFHGKLTKKKINSVLSISHEKDYAIAMVLLK